MVQLEWWAACGGTDFAPVRQGAKTSVTELVLFELGLFSPECL